MILNEVQICNMALDLIKVEPITNIRDAKTKTEAMCSRWYDTTRRQVLRAHPWNFAKSRATLSRNSADPLFGFPDQYALPNDFIRLRFIEGYEENGLTGLRYQIEGGFLLFDNGGGSSLDIGYIKDEITVAKFDELFKRYLATQMALNMSYGFSGKTNLRRDINELLQDIRVEARAVNGQDSPPRRVLRSKVIGARRQYSSGSGFMADPTLIIKDF